MAQRKNEVLKIVNFQKITMSAEMAVSILCREHMYESIKKQKTAKGDFKKYYQGHEDAAQIMLCKLGVLFKNGGVA